MCNSEVIHIVILPETWGKWGRSPASSPHSQAWPRTASAACRSHGSVCSEPKSASCTGGSSQTLGRCLALAVKCQTGQLKKETKNSINHKNLKNQCRHKVEGEVMCSVSVYVQKMFFILSPSVAYPTDNKSLLFFARKEGSCTCVDSLFLVEFISLWYDFNYVCKTDSAQWWKHFHCVVL